MPSRVQLRGSPSVSVQPRRWTQVRIKVMGPWLVTSVHLSSSMSCEYVTYLIGTDRIAWIGCVSGGEARKRTYGVPLQALTMAVLRSLTNLAIGRRLSAVVGTCIVASLNSRPCWLEISSAEREGGSVASHIEMRAQHLGPRFDLEGLEHEEQRGVAFRDLRILCLQKGARQPFRAFNFEPPLQPPSDQVLSSKKAEYSARGVTRFTRHSAFGHGRD